MAEKLKIAVSPSRLHRLDLFEAAGFEVVIGKISTEDDMIELMQDADAAHLYPFAAHCRFFGGVSQ